ncbi:MAG: hypothetical protein QOD87_2137, partial [Pseudonocardiales bacterium]|nr:hypothetical protein [Pseudonocardiales bacterium]
EALLAGDLDVALVDVYDGVPVPMPDYLTVTDLCTEPLVVVSKTGTFALRQSVHLAELADSAWVMPPVEVGAGPFQQLQDAPGPFDQGASSSGEQHASVGTVQQAGTGLAFEDGELLGHR